MSFSSTQLQTRSFHIDERTRTSAKCPKMNVQSVQNCFHFQIFVTFLFHVATWQTSSQTCRKGRAARFFLLIQPITQITDLRRYHSCCRRRFVTPYHFTYGYNEFLESKGPKCTYVQEHKLYYCKYHCGGRRENKN